MEKYEKKYIKQFENAERIFLMRDLIPVTDIRRIIMGYYISIWLKKMIRTWYWHSSDQISTKVNAHHNNIMFGYQNKAPETYTTQKVVYDSRVYMIVLEGKLSINKFNSTSRSDLILKIVNKKENMTDREEIILLETRNEMTVGSSVWIGGNCNGYAFFYMLDAKNEYNTNKVVTVLSRFSRRIKNIR